MPKVVAGRFKGIRIYTPKHKRIKPTSSVVKRAIFDYLGDYVIDKEILDLYAGTGGLGIEALSRGAKSAVFVENDPECVKVLRKNLSQLKGVKVEVIPLDVFMGLRMLRGRKFDIVFLDPPYAQKLVKSTLMELAEYDIVKENSFVIAEHHKKEVIAEKIGYFKLERQRGYGETFVSIFRRQG
jgi:16S rRNA (guanine(966)-N(2))-methyltransferase RsmD